MMCCVRRHIERQKIVTTAGWLNDKMYKEELGSQGLSSAAVRSENFPCIQMVLRKDSCEEPLYRDPDAEILTRPKAKRAEGVIHLLLISELEQSREGRGCH